MCIRDSSNTTLGYRLVTSSGGSPYMKYFPADPRTIHKMEIKPGMVQTHSEGIYFIPGTCSNLEDCSDLEMTIAQLLTPETAYNKDLELWRVRAWNWIDTAEYDDEDLWNGGRALKIKYIRREPQLLQRFIEDLKISHLGPGYAILEELAPLDNTDYNTIHEYIADHFYRNVSGKSKEAKELENRILSRLRSDPITRDRLARRVARESQSIYDRGQFAELLSGINVQQIKE